MVQKEYGHKNVSLDQIVQFILDGTHNVRYFKGMIFSVRDNGKITVVDILQNTIIFANNDVDEDNMDRECQIIKEKNDSFASNYVFQWLSCHF